MDSTISSNANIVSMGVSSITYKKSAIGYGKDQKATIRALGFTKLGQTLDLDLSNPSIAGMVHKVQHLVEIHIV